MKFEDSPLSKKYHFSKQKTAYGTLYFIGKIVVAELNYGLHLDWEKVEILIRYVTQHYAPNTKIGYISNKTNAYSFEPNLWSKFLKEYTFLVKSVSVCYTEINYANGLIEEQISNNKVKAVRSIEEGFEWLSSLKALKN